MKPRRVVVAGVVLAAFVLCSGEARADHTIRPFPAAALAGYAPMLAHAEMAVVETDPAGHARQMTVLGYAPAPPAMLHDLVAHPEAYPSFVHNLTRSDVERRADGTLVNRWRIAYPIGGFEGTDELRLAPPEAGHDGAPGTPGVIDSRSVGPGKDGVFRWEFLPAPGGGTVVVDYGFYDSLADNALLGAMMKKNPAYEAGFNLAGALTVMRSLLAEATRRAAAAGLHVAPPTGTTPGFATLLDRGTLAVVRSDAAGALVDVSVVERVPAPLPILEHLVRDPESWPRFQRSIKSVDVKQRDDAGLEYEMRVAGLLLDVVTRYRTNFIPHGSDTLGVGGELTGSRYRWDLSAGPSGQAGSAGASTVAVWRGNLHLGHGSALLRTMFKIEPSFEHAANVSVGLISMRAMAGRAAEEAHAAAAPPTDAASRANVAAP